MWVVVTLAGLAALLIFILCVPLDITFNVNVNGRPKFGLRLVWLFGLVSKGIRKGEKKPKKPKKVTEEKPKRRDKRAKTSAIFQILRTRGLLRKFRQLLTGILGSLQIRELGASFRIGLDNPADTGLLFAFIGPITAFFSSSHLHQLRVEPSFGDTAVCEGDLHGAVRLQPIRFVPPIIGFAFSLPAIRTLKVLILHKWRRKK